MNIFHLSRLVRDPDDSRICGVILSDSAYPSAINVISGFIYLE